MGNYNPHAPAIVGQEWVPILSLPYEPELRLERGHGFTLPQQATLGAAAVYVDTLPGQALRDQVGLVSVYERGKEGIIGPIGRVVLTVEHFGFGFLTGDVAVVNASSQQEAVESAGDNKFLRFSTGSGRARHFFDIFLTTLDVDILQGRRILDVNVLYTISGTAFPLPAGSSIELRVASDDASVLYEEVTTGVPSLAQTQIKRCRLGEVTPWWRTDPGTENGVMDPGFVYEQYPWRFEDITRFDRFASDRISFDVVSTNIPDGVSIDVGFVALEVIFSEENRVAYGGRQFGDLTGEVYGKVWRLGQNLIPLADQTLEFPTLQPGDYTCTFRLAPSRVALATGANPKINAVRQLYELPTHPGSTVTVPQRQGDIVTVAPADLLPQISLHEAIIDEVNDLFDRVVANGWGTATSGQTWETIGGAASDYNVNGTVGTHTVNAANSPRLSRVIQADFDVQSCDIYVEVETSALAAGAPLDVVTRAPVNFAGIRFETNQNVRATIRNADTNAEFAGTVVAGLTHTINTRFSIRVRLLGATVSVRVWLTAGDEPSQWHATFTNPGDVGVLSSNRPVGLRSLRVSGNTNNVTTSWDNLGVTPFQTLTDTHVYGDAFDVPLYDDSDGGGEFAVPEQTIVQAADGPAVPYAWIRFYARKFGDEPNSARLFVDGGFVASVTSTELDSLPEIADGWREVTVRLDPPIVLDDSGTAKALLWVIEPDPFVGQFTVDAANRWEILAAAAPALSGPFGQLSPAARLTLDHGTYGGTDAQLVIVSTRTEFDSTFPWVDATILLSQDPPEVTDLTVEVMAQPLTGIGMDCGIDPRCVPTGILLHELTWADVGRHNFDKYEIQRFDAIDGVWHTIALIDCHEHTTFIDFEARVGVESRYRLRVLNLYDFAGPWSPEVVSTLPAPGVVGNKVGNGVLIFTSNERQDGAINLAHTMAWRNTRPEEQFTFPEAEEVQFQPMFGRDYRVAFKPLERGGERFTRTLLVQAAAIPPPALGNFHSLRDMAWDTVPYICVRDELGDRWLAAVQVPDGNVRRNRRLYLARVDITEVTDTPSAVSPECEDEES